MNEFITAPYIFCISYEQDFNLEKGEKHTTKVCHSKYPLTTTAEQFDNKEILTQR